MAREDALSRLMKAYPTFTAWRRATNPRLRRTRPTAIRETGPRRTLIDCLCGASISYCTAWPVTRRVVMWRREHDVSCWPDGVPFQEYRQPDPYGQDGGQRRGVPRAGGGAGGGAAPVNARCRICAPHAEGQGLCWHHARLLVEVGRAVDELFDDKEN